MNELDIIRNHFLGFQNDFFDSFRRVSTYPPYNIREKDDKGVIEFAVAGFTEEDLKTSHAYYDEYHKDEEVNNNDGTINDYHTRHEDQHLEVYCENHPDAFECRVYDE